MMMANRIGCPGQDLSALNLNLKGVSIVVESGGQTLASLISPLVRPYGTVYVWTPPNSAQDVYQHSINGYVAGDRC